MFSLAKVISISLSVPLLMTSALSVRGPAGGCDVSADGIPNLPTSLAAPTTPLSFVAVAVGTQNYSCNAAGNYTNVGALAELFDISCLFGTPSFGTVQDQAISAWTAEPAGLSTPDLISALRGPNPTLSAPLQVLGQHYYVVNPLTGTGINPKWDFTSSGTTAGNPNAFVTAAKVSSIGAPTGSQDIDWVDLKNLVGSLAQQVYRTDTRLGQPPASCTPGSPNIFVKYSAKYYFFGSSL